MTREEMLDRFKRECDSALRDGIIALDPEEKNLVYLALNKKYRLSDPEEFIRAKAYISLIQDDVPP